MTKRKLVCEVIIGSEFLHRIFAEWMSWMRTAKGDNFGCQFFVLSVYFEDRTAKKIRLKSKIKIVTGKMKQG